MPCAGEPDPAAHPGEELHAQLVIEGADLFRQGWLGQVEDGSRARKTAHIGRNDERANPREVYVGHADSLCRSEFLSFDSAGCFA